MRIARSFLLSAFVLSPTTYAAKLPNTFDGYVTNLAGATEFDVGTRHVVLDKDVKPELSPLTEIGPGTIDSNLHVGSHVHVEGKFVKGSGEFVAKAVLVLPDSTSIGKRRIEGAGLIEELPRVHKDGQGWSGTIWVNGYPLQLTPNTDLLAEDGTAFPLDKAATNFWVEYRAERQSDYSLKALSLKFSPLHIDAGEQKYRDRSEPEIEKPDYAKHIPGKVKWHLSWTLDILSDQTIQDYATAVGTRLIPEYQKDLPASDPTKITFRFYVVQRPSKLKETSNDASASPGGVVVVPDNVLVTLDNEAQLAALLSNCIATTIEREFYQHHSRIKAQRALGWGGLATIGGVGGGVLIGDAIATHDLMLEINERASRAGLRYMLHSGYDLREAPFAWTAAANKKVRNPEEAVGVVPSALTRSVMDDLRFDYDAVDYSQLKTNREAYHQMLAELRAAAPNPPKPKNHE
jgi:hypothetical protein